MEDPTGLLQLPRELRDMIYDILAEEEDLSSLMHSCRLLRREILSRLPGADIIDYGNTSSVSQILDSIHVSSLNIIAEPWYSSGSALKIEVTWRPRIRSGPSRLTGSQRVSRWTIRDLSSPMARYIYLCKTYHYNVIFEPATRGCFLLALLILRAKVFDISRILTNIAAKNEGWLAPDDFSNGLTIQFRGGKDPEHPKRLRKSFWEMRPVHIVHSRRHIREGRYQGQVWKRSIQLRELYPFYYECLMLPLFSCGPWVPNEIGFDLCHAEKHTSLHRKGWEGGGSVNQGLSLLFHLTRHMKHLELSDISRSHIPDYETDAGEDEDDEDDGDHESISQWFDVMSREEYFTNGVKILLNYASRCLEADQLRQYMLRMRNAHPCNPFALPLETDPWARDQDSRMRLNFIEWALENGDEYCPKTEEKSAECTYQAFRDVEWFWCSDGYGWPPGDDRGLFIQSNRVVYD